MTYNVFSGMLNLTQSINVHHDSLKKQATIILPVTACQMLTDFQNSFTDRFTESMKQAVMQNSATQNSY